MTSHPGGVVVLYSKAQAYVKGMEASCFRYPFMHGGGLASVLSRNQSQVLMPLSDDVR
jgi:hypothetical protein